MGEGARLPRGELSPYLRLLVAKVGRKPDITMPEIADKCDEAHGVWVRLVAVARPAGSRVHLTAP